MTITDSGHIATVISTAATHVGARSSSQKNTGKYYFEAVWLKRQENWNGVGIFREDATYLMINNNNTGGTFVQSNAFGTIYSNNTLSGKSLGSPVTGDRIGIAINLDLRRAWFRKNGGLWNNTSGADPVANTGAVVIEIAGELLTGLRLRGQHDRTQRCLFLQLRRCAFCRRAADRIREMVWQHLLAVFRAHHHRGER